MIYHLRPAQEVDEPFLLQLFTSTHGQELLLVPLPEPQRDLLIHMQFRAQAASYHAQYPTSEHSIIEVAGISVGHLWLGVENDAFRVVDLAILPEYQRVGIGSHILTNLISRVTTSPQSRLRLSVMPTNEGALRLYQRLGFVLCNTNALYLQMERIC